MAQKAPAAFQMAGRLSKVVSLVDSAGIAFSVCRYTLTSSADSSPTSVLMCQITR